MNKYIIIAMAGVVALLDTFVEKAVVNTAIFVIVGVAYCISGLNYLNRIKLVAQYPCLLA